MQLIRSGDAGSFLFFLQRLDAAKNERKTPEMTSSNPQTLPTFFRYLFLEYILQGYSGVGESVQTVNRYC